MPGKKRAGGIGPEIDWTVRASQLPACARASAAQPRLLAIVVLLLATTGCWQSGEAPIAPAREPVAERVRADAIRIRWDRAPADVLIDIYAGSSPDSIDRARSLAVLEDGEAIVTGFPALPRPFFALESGEGGVRRIVAERLIPLHGTHNFRDLGGYETRDGRFVRWGRLFRSDHLADLDDADLARLSELGVRLVVDFRSKLEVEEDPNHVPDSSGIRSVNPAIHVEGATPAAIEKAIRSGNEEGMDFDALLVDANRMFVTDATPQFATLFRTIENPAELPLVFHCTAGKDRTGFASAMILSALGVPRDTIAEDYMLTEVYGFEHIQQVQTIVRFASLFRIDAEEVRPLLGVRPHFLEAAFDTIEARYGSVDRYLTEGLGLTPAKREALQHDLLY